VSSLGKWDQIIALLKRIDRDRPDIKTVILDDIGHVMVKEAFARISESGFGKFNEIGHHMSQIFNCIENLRADLIVVFMFHAGTEFPDGLPAQTKIKTFGKVIDSWYKPEEAFEIVLFSDVEFDAEDGEPIFQFITKRTPSISQAKTPAGMFDERKIPNDLGLLTKRIIEFYG